MSKQDFRSADRYNVWLAGPEAVQTRFLNIAVTQILSHEATAWIYNPPRSNTSAVMPQEWKMIDVTNF